MNLGLSGAWLTVNRACNFRCKWCYASETEYQQEDEMTPTTAVELLHLASDLGITHILFIGGEPTLWPHLCKTIKDATELGLRTVLITNGFRLADKYFVDELQSAGLNGVNLSMKAGDPLLHADLTRTKISAFDTVLNGIRNLANSSIQFEVTTIANTCVLDHMDKPFRNKGYGHAAMAIIEDEAKNMEAKKISLKVSELNEVAIGVYKKAGFKEKEL